MALVLADRVKDTTTTTGQGTVTLSGTAPTGFQNFSVIGDGNTTYYTIAGGSEWEVGIGTYTSSGTTLSRDTVLSSSAGGTTKVTFSAGTKDVFVTLPAEVVPNYVYTKTTFTATAGQTTFTVAYTVGYIDVYLNGVKLTTSEYTATNGTSVVLGTAAALNDIVETIAWSTFSATNTNIGVGTGTSLALGGATIGTNALAVTGTAAISGATTLGVASTTQGSLVLANTSANSTTIKSSNSASAAYTITLPVSAGTSGQVLSTDGTGITSWITVSGAEYGTWTPGLSFGGGTTGITYGGQSGTYVKAGRSVLYGIYINTTSKGSSTGLARITGCPYTVESGSTTRYSYGQPVNGGSGITVTSAYTLFLGTYYTGSATTLDFYEVSLGTPSSMSNTAFSNSMTFYGAVSVITTA